MMDRKILPGTTSTNRTSLLHVLKHRQEAGQTECRSTNAKDLIYARNLGKRKLPAIYALANSVEASVLCYAIELSSNLFRTHNFIFALMSAFAASIQNALVLGMIEHEFIVVEMPEPEPKNDRL